MIFIVNTNAGGGRAAKRWASVRDELDASGVTGTAFLSRTASELLDLVRMRYARGERTFIAAGGDGTVNSMVNSLADATTAGRNGSLTHIRIGAVGLGSSNDFHKPLRYRAVRCGVPVAIDPSRSRPRDAVSVTVRDDGLSRTRWLLLNASFGFTAAANRRFNNGGAVLKVVKRLSTPAAIIFAITRTLMRLPVIRLTVTPADRNGATYSVTNLAVLKSPWVSGALKFPEDWTQRGMMGVVLLSRASRVFILRFLRGLLGGECAESSHCSHFLTSGMTVTSDTPVDLEIDGEIIHGDRFEFTVHRDFLRVCA